MNFMINMKRIHENINIENTTLNYEDITKLY